MCGIVQLHAADVTFTGGTSNSWTLDANWSGGSALAADVDGQITIQSGNGASPFTLTGIDLAYTNIGGMLFDGTGTDGDYTLQGTGSLTFNTGTGIFNGKTGTATIGVDIVSLGSSFTVSALVGGISLTGDVGLTGGVQCNFSGSSAINASGVISGNGTVNVSGGSSIVTLTGANTYTNGTTFSGGTIILGNDDALGTGTLTLNTDLGQAIQSDNDARSVSNAIDLGSNTLTVDGDNNLVLSGVISGDGALTLNMDASSDTLTLSGANTYTGGTTITSGTLILGNDDALGTGDVTTGTNNGRIQSDDDSRNIGNNFITSPGNALAVTGSNKLTLSGIISGSSGLAALGDTTILLTGNNTYTGNTLLANSENTIIFGNDNAIGTADLLVNFSSSIESNDDARSVGNGIRIASDQTLTVSGDSNLALSGVISGDGSVNQSGSGTFTLSGTNTYTGGTALSGSTIILGNDDALGTGSVVISGDTVFESDNDARTVGNAININSEQTLTVGGGNNLELSGVISGDGVLALDMSSNTETFTLSGNNTYSGGTTLDLGTVIVAHDNAFGTGNVTVTNFGRLQSDDDARNISNNFITSSGNDVFIVGSNQLTLSGTISGSGGIASEAGSSVLLTGNNTYTGSTFMLGGTIIVGNDNALGTGNVSLNASSTISSNDDARLISNTFSTVSTAILTVSGSNDLELSGVISGGGGLNVSLDEPTDALTLSGVNTYTGDTTLSSGKIIVGNDSAFGTGSVLVEGDAVLEGNSDSRSISNSIGVGSGHTLTVSGESSNNLEISGVISGDGALVKSGGSELTLGSDNTHTGGTTLSEGAIVIESSQSLGRGLFNVTGDSRLAASDDFAIRNATSISNGVSLLLDGSKSSFSYSGIISGDGSLALEMSGKTITISGNNTYTGGTSSKDGGLILGHNNALGTGSLTLDGAVTIQSNDDTRSISNAIGFTSESNSLTFNGSNDLTLSGIISGEGSLTKSATNTLTLGGANTYSGGTTLSGGTVILGHDDALGAGGVSVASSSTIESSDDARTVNNDFSVSLMLTVGGSNDLELAGVISGNGSLTKEGSGTLTLSGSNTYTGETAVRAGTLIVNANMGNTNMFVYNGATLGGAMSIAGNCISSGTISPGNSAGTMVVGGTLTLNSSSIYDMEIESTAGAGTGNDLIDVTGSAAIDGTLNVIGLPGYVPEDGDTFTILEADDGVSGTFATISDDIAGFEVSATYNATDIVITLNEALADFSSITQRNLFSAADAFERISQNSPTGDIATVIAQLENQTGQALVVAFEQIVPNYLVPQAEATFKGIDVQNNNFNGRLNELRYDLPKLWSNNLSVNTPQGASIEESVDPEYVILFAMQTQETLEQQQETNRFSGVGKDIWGAWINGFGTFGDFDSTSSQAGYEFNTAGVTFGFDYRVLDSLAAGAFFGYSNTGITVDSGQGTSSFNSINTGMYMTWFNEEGFYASGLFGGGVNFYENNRRIVFGMIDRVAESDPTGFYLQALATGGYEFKSGNWGFGPQLALQWVNLQIESHSETGADSLNLDVGAFNGNSFVTRLGFRTTYKYDTSAMLFIPELVGFWEHEYLSPIDTVEVGIPSGPDSFAYSGIGPGRDSGLIGVNLIGISHEQPISFTV
ncbi:autotransporter domain-containing protein [Poriferisphaera corsica]|nr:autotransporter domain-containing protein [Poriferisphaera corsica]